MPNDAALRKAEVEVARAEARRLLEQSKATPDPKQRSALLARALRLAVRAERMDRGW
jgi:hypothetical protein